MTTLTLSWYWKRLKVMSLREVVHRLNCRLTQRLVIPRVLGAAAPPLSWDDISNIQKVNEQYWSSWDPGEFVRVFHHQVHWKAIDWLKNFPENIRVDALSPNYHNTEEVGDPKLIWELNRFKEFVVWAQDGKFERIDKLLGSWMAQNPPYVGIQWTSALEAAIRSWALIRVLAYVELIRNEPLGATLIEKIQIVLYCNGWFIASNLSLGSSANNHLLGEALGLYACGLAFGKTELGRKWRKQGKRIFESEYLRQTHDSGICGEGSTYYQCYVADMGLLYCTITSGVTDQLRTRVARVADSILWWSQWSETLPLIGDDDGGIFTPHGDAANYYTFYEELSRLRQEILPHIPIHKTPPADFAVFDAGDLGQLIIRTGPFGLPPLYAHSHADLGSVLAFRKKRPVLVDPGTGRYFEQDGLRTLMRQSTSHNTIADETSEKLMNGPFMWENAPQVVTVERTEQVLTLKIKSGSIETIRRISMDGERRLVIEDIVFNPLRHRVYQTWNFAEEFGVSAGEAMTGEHDNPEAPKTISGLVFPLGDLTLSLSPSPGLVRYVKRLASLSYNTVMEIPSLVREENQEIIKWTTMLTVDGGQRHARC